MKISMKKLYSVMLLMTVQIPFVYSQTCIEVDDDTDWGSLNQYILDLDNQGGGCIHILPNTTAGSNGEYQAADLVAALAFDYIKIHDVNNIKLVIHATITSNTASLINIYNANNISILGDKIGALKPDLTIAGDGWNGVVTRGTCDNLLIEGFYISDFPNKGIDVIGTDVQNVTIRDNVIQGTSTSKGAAAIGIANSLPTIPFHGHPQSATGLVKHVLVENNTLKNNRVGITVNKSNYINIRNNTVTNNSLFGIGLDGMEKNSGDGASHCIVSGNIVTLNGGDTSKSERAGIYMGNGASNNVVSNNIIRDNYYIGIYFYDDVRVDPLASQTIIANNQILNNGNDGIYTVRLYSGSIVGNQIIGNGADGIQLNDGFTWSITGNVILNNGQMYLNLNNTFTTGDDHGNVH
ncbi:MAG TPA: hypothetical protein DCE41_01665 [Cytophagales bacterium]|nr:hypothetical protein [Cytophagales bacterium]HAA18047.1 hypothetical protein [Cytophagales bacterium]HAP64530.1 hypothetical protein [Cytophagales bacterium]